ncbi:MAG: hypothetical protein LBH07_00275 [Treponema sp.]|jgi:hypothetical protein|nr:hypothetical protein [Treponema sp.]
MRRIKRNKLLPFFFLLFCTLPLFALGKKEEEKREPQNIEFTLCITAFDVSALPPGQQALGSVLQRELALDLNQIHHRLRGDEELTRYEELARIAAMYQAAAKLAAKREERDAQLYQGSPKWKYKKELKRINKELKELEAAFKKAEEEKPIIEEKPLFKINTINSGAFGTFPLAPKKGGEEAFLKTHNSDAYLEGKFRLLYGRVYGEFHIYARGASFVYNDITIFSPDDLNAAASQIKRRFLTALANSQLALLVLNADPVHTRLELNGMPVKSGEPLELPPGPAFVRATADDHQSVTKEIELFGGETEEMAFVLKPLTMETLHITLAKPGNSIYLGALRLEENSDESETEITEEESEVSGENINGEINDKDAIETAEGEIPAEEKHEETAKKEFVPGFFPVQVPVGQYRYIRMETEDGLTGEVIVKGESGDKIRIITLEPRKLPGSSDKPVEEKRKKFYGAYGRFWVTLPMAFLLNGVFQLYNITYTSAVYTTGSQDLFPTAQKAYYVAIGAWATAGFFLAESLVRMGIYVHTASKESIPLWE